MSDVNQKADHVSSAENLFNDAVQHEDGSELNVLRAFVSDSSSGKEEFPDGSYEDSEYLNMSDVASAIHDDLKPAPGDIVDARSHPAYPIPPSPHWTPDWWHGRGVGFTPFPFPSPSGFHPRSVEQSESHVAEAVFPPSPPGSSDDKNPKPDFDMEKDYSDLSLADDDFRGNEHGKRDVYESRKDHADASLSKRQQEIAIEFSGLLNDSSMKDGLDGPGDFGE